jgi:rhodanese-related sulfurtransferase
MRTVLCLLSSKAALVELRHAGVRSRQLLGYRLAADFENVFNLYRGSGAWSQAIAPQVPRY